MPIFDFIFSHNIKGLITKYGGANSHMSIKMSRTGITMIGVGDQRYNDFIKSKVINMNCLNKKL